MEDNGILTDAIRKEVIPITTAFQKMAYETFLNYSKKMNKSDAVMETSIESDLSERSIWYIIAKMES